MFFTFRMALLDKLADSTRPLSQFLGWHTGLFSTHLALGVLILSLGLDVYGEAVHHDGVSNEEAIGILIHLVVIGWPCILLTRWMRKVRDADDAIPPLPFSVGTWKDIHGWYLVFGLISIGFVLAGYAGGGPWLKLQLVENTLDLLATGMLWGLTIPGRRRKLKDRVKDSIRSLSLKPAHARN